MKSDNRMMRKNLKGNIGDTMNLMLAAAAFNFKKWMREAQNFYMAILITIIIEDKKHEQVS